MGVAVVLTSIISVCLSLFVFTGYSIVDGWVRLLAGVALVLTSMINTCGAVDWRRPCSGSSPADRVSRYVSPI